MGNTAARAPAYSITRNSSSGDCLKPSGSLEPMCVCTSKRSSGPCSAASRSQNGRLTASMSTMGRGTLQRRPEKADTGVMHFRRERVRVETARHEIVGTLQLPNEGFRSRTTDFLNANGDHFLALTDAEITWLDGERPPQRLEFLAVAARHVVLGGGLQAP